MKIKASYKFSTKIILALGTFGFSILTYNLFKPIPDQKYIQIPDLIFTLISLFFTVVSAYYLIKNEVIILKNDTLITKSFFGLLTQKYNLKELNWYTLIEKENKYINWEDLDLSFPTKKLRITSSNFTAYQYYRLKSEVRVFADENIEEKRNWESKHLKRFGIGIITIGLIFSYLFYNQDNEGNRIIEETNTILIEGRVARKVEIEKGSRNSKSLELRLRSYPYFIFKLNKPEINALNEAKFLGTIKKGQQIKLRIWNEIYEKKLVKTKKMDFRDKHFNYYSIDILGIKKSNVNYLTIDRVNKSREHFHTKGNYYGLLAFATFVIGVGLLCIFLSYKLKQSAKSPTY